MCAHVSKCKNAKKKQKRKKREEKLKRKLKVYIVPKISSLLWRGVGFLCNQ
jgi:hypothetical protein